MKSKKYIDIEKASSRGIVVGNIQSNVEVESVRSAEEKIEDLCLLAKEKGLEDERETCVKFAERNLMDSQGKFNIKLLSKQLLCENKVTRYLLMWNGTGKEGNVEEIPLNVYDDNNEVMEEVKFSCTKMVLPGDVTIGELKGETTEIYGEGIKIDF